VLVGVWIAVTMVGLGSMSVSHMLAMPAPDDETRMTRAMLALRHDSAEPLMIHVIYAGCSCTNRLFAHLIERGPFSGTEEIVLFVGEDRAKQQSAVQRGFAYRTISPGELTSQYGLESAPVLIAFDTAGQLRYAGGYYDHPAALAPRDESIHAQLARGAAPTPLPVFGCAVSTRLQRSVDPLGLVYSKPTTH
jgi:hypothetical protein